MYENSWWENPQNTVEGWAHGHGPWVVCKVGLTTRAFKGSSWTLVLMDPGHQFEAGSNHRYEGSFHGFSHQGSWRLVWWNFPKGEVLKARLKIGARSQTTVSWGNKKSYAKVHSTGFSCRRGRRVLQVPIQLSLF